jgi:hypothetical protein
MAVRRHSDDLGDDAFFFQAHSFFNSNFVKRVHAHFDVGDIHTGVVRFDTNFNVVINNAFDCDQDFHCFNS